MIRYGQGARVRLAYDPRHVGVVLASGPDKARVLWDDTGFESCEPHSKLEPEHLRS